MIKKLVKLAVFLLIVNALYQTAPVWLRHYQFKDAVNEMALFSKETTDAAILDRVMLLAEKHVVPLDREEVQVHRSKDRLTIDASYVETVTIVPGYEYRWPFRIGIDVLHMALPAVGK